MGSATEEVYVLQTSFAQQRIWFLDQLEPENPAYIISMAVRLQGKLELEPLREALQAVVARHESLRTTFADVDGDGMPHQVVAAESTVGLPVLSLTDLSEADQASCAATLVAREAALPFDLGRGPLLRARVLRFAVDDHVLMLSMHHIISDGWSQGILIEELGAHYEAALSGRPAALPELEIQYADYAVWQREQLDGTLFDKEIEHWRSTLSGAPALISLPTDRPRPAAQSFRGASVGFTLPNQLHQRLTAFGQARRATPFMVLLAAYVALLARHSGQDDIVVGTPVAGRTRPELEGLIGLFVNTLALRTELDDDPDFETLLDRVRQTALTAYSHQDLPLERLVEALEPERSLSHNPLFQTLFVLQNTPGATSKWVGLNALPLEGGGERTRTAKFDLTMALSESSQGIDGSLEYNSDLFDRSTAERMADRYVRLLDGCLTRPDRPVSTILLATPAELRTVLDEFSGTRPYRAEHSGQGIHDQFSAQAARAPEAPAVVHRSGVVTYRELDERSNRLAHHLRELGARPETLVGVCLSRTPDLVVAMLAILKSGAAYLPLDPAYPPERLSLMQADAGSPLIVTSREHAPRLATAGNRLLCLDTDAELIDGRPATPPSGACDGRQLAYMLYTSGSTGRPKGVTITHGSVHALAAWARDHFPAGTFGNTLATTSVCFDLSVFEILLPLAGGDTITLLDNALELLDRPGIEATLLNTVPSVLTELLRHGALPPTIGTICLAGEPLPAALVEQARRGSQASRIHNLYGPSEATTYSTVADLDPSDPNPPDIGRPIAGTRTYILDANLSPSPVGIPGHLYIAGAGLSRGYHGQPALTADRFIPNPYAVTPGDRLYRTGDLASWKPDGSITFHGRADHQIKLRGYRIEPDEIANTLAAHPGIGEAHVQLREDTPGHRRLVAYVVPEVDGSAASPEELLAYCRRRLPGYLVPAAIVALDRLPLTPNGKLNRAALPAPAQNTPATAYVPAETPLQTVIAGIWQSVLHVRRVGIHDDFFALGGHSLLAMQVLARLRATLAPDLLLRILFEQPTVAGLAQALIAREQEPGQIEAIAEVLLHVESLSAEEVQTLLNEGE